MIEETKCNDSRKCQSATTKNCPVHDPGLFLSTLFDSHLAPSSATVYICWMKHSASSTPHEIIIRAHGTVVILVGKEIPIQHTYVVAGAAIDECWFETR